MSGQEQTPPSYGTGYGTLPARISARHIAAITAGVAFVTRHRSTLILAGIVLASIGGVSWSGFLTLRNQRYLEQARQGVNETFAVKLLVSDVLVLLMDIETGGRGYALTGNTLFLEPLFRAEAKLQAALTELSAAVSTEQPQARPIERLAKLADQRLNHAHTLVQLISEGAAPARVSEHAIGGYILTERIRELTAETWAIEAVDFAAQSAHLADAMATARYFTWWLVGAQVALLIALGGLALRWSRVQAMVKICAWSRTIEYEGEWITFEDYLQRHFGLLSSHGINPDEAEKFLQKVNRP